MPPDLWSLYPSMLRSRLFDEAVAKLWHDGLISGEMHQGTGEEAVVVGVVDHVREGDAMALDHRGTAALLVRGVDPALILGELLGLPEGLCGGMGGHMHLYSKAHLAAASGIVGAAGPTGAGFALAAQFLRPGAIAVAFFGDGAMNQGMLMESMNLASVWSLPVVFVCKDDGWSITTRSEQMTGGSLSERARALGVPAVDVDGLDVSDVWDAARDAFDRARSGGGPTFLHAHCVHLEGHFLGYQLLKIVRQPLKEVREIAVPLTRSTLRLAGAPWRERMEGLRAVLGAVVSTLRDPGRDPGHDPLPRARAVLRSEPERLEELESRVTDEMGEILGSVLEQVRS
jgi:acetoin:2,6-dichlorophenolindophenol oxidoreductase subunit alpha